MAPFNPFHISLTFIASIAPSRDNIERRFSPVADKNEELEVDLGKVGSGESVIVVGLKCSSTS